MVSLGEVPSSFSLWTIFDTFWTLSVGYTADGFNFEIGKTPLSTFTETVSWIVAYLAVIFGGRELMRNRQPFKLDGLFMAHNLMLTIVSGVLLVLFAEQLVPALWKKGLYENICGDSGWTQSLMVLYYLNYLIKYIELMDTVFLMVKKKPLTFLHCYHHPATASLCYIQLVGRTPVSWVPITLNLTVHVVMYWYYFQSARGIRVSWKEWITRLQIAQFIIDLGFVYFATYDYYSSVYFPSFPHVGTCRGEPFAAFSGCAILSSYLFLFISFYISTYKKMSNRRIAANIAHQAERKMERLEVPTMIGATGKASLAVNVINSRSHSINPQRSRF